MDRPTIIACLCALVLGVDVILAASRAPSWLFGALGLVALVLLGMALSIRPGGER